MNKQKGTILLLLIASFLLIACQSGEPPADELEQGLNQAPDAVLENVLPEQNDIPKIQCDFSSYLEAPKALQPHDGEMVSVLKPTFKWDFDFECGFFGWDLEVFLDDPFGGLALAYKKTLPPFLKKLQIDVELLRNSRYVWRIIPSEYENDEVDISNAGEAFFWTGPFCPLEKLQAPKILNPTDGLEVQSDAPYPFLIAKHPGGCAAKEFEFRLSKFSSFEFELLDWSKFHNSTNILDIRAVEGSTYTEHLDMCTWYFWQLRAVHEDGPGPWSSTRSFLWNKHEDCSRVFDLFIDIPKEALFPDFPHVWPIQDANCREGDSTQHRNIGTLFPNQSYTILAINPSLSHIRVEIPNIDVRCWADATLLQPAKSFWPLAFDQIGEFVDVYKPGAPPTAIPDPTKAPVAPAVPSSPTATSQPPQCSDGLDNDGDGAIDYGTTAQIAAGAADRECSSPSDDNEFN